MACRKDTYIETTYISKTICRNFDYIIKGSCNTCGSKTVQTDLDSYMEVHASLLIDGVKVCTKVNVQALS